MKLFFAALLVAGPACADPVPVPSGQPVEFVELITDVPGSAGVTWRFRFLAPEISRNGGSVSAEALAGDIDALCNGFVMTRLSKAAEAPEQVILSLSDIPVDFGVAAPESTQVFEAYRVEEGHCIWEGL